MLTLIGLHPRVWGGCRNMDVHLAASFTWRHRPHPMPVLGGISLLLEDQVEPGIWGTSSGTLGGPSVTPSPQAQPRLQERWGCPAVAVFLRIPVCTCAGENGQAGLCGHLGEGCRKWRGVGIPVPPGVLFGDVCMHLFSFSGLFLCKRDFLHLSAYASGWEGSLQVFVSVFGRLGIGLGAGSQGALVCISDVSLSSGALCRLRFFVVFFVMFQCGITGFENLFCVSVCISVSFLSSLPSRPLVCMCSPEPGCVASLLVCVLLTSSHLSLSPSLGELSRQQRRDARGCSGIRGYAGTSFVGSCGRGRG